MVSSYRVVLPSKQHPFPHSNQGRTTVFLCGFRDFDQIEIRVAHIYRTQPGHRSSLRYRPLDDFYFQFLQFPDDLVERHGGDEAKIERPWHGDMRARLELLAPLVQVDFLL